MPEEKNLSQPRKFSSVDIGIDNLAAVTFSDSVPFIINVKPLKSINQHFNKINAKLRSQQRKINDEDYSSTNKMLTLSRKRDSHKKIRNKVRISAERQIKILCRYRSTDL